MERSCKHPKAGLSSAQRLADSPSAQIIGEPEDFFAVLDDFMTRPRVRGPIVHDARVAAICVAQGIEALLTRDRDFSLFPELRRRSPKILDEIRQLPPSAWRRVTLDVWSWWARCARHTRRGSSSSGGN
ncbi:MAG: type II toxin-antitoxin system VapC family toxin [Gammaproteobacteria bacterium]